MTHKIIGMGTGRCGTRSLAKLLNSGHEQRYLPWAVDTEMADDFLETVDRDVGFYWINYVDYVASKYKVSFICLKREKEDVISSFTGQNLICDMFKERLEISVTQQELDSMDEFTKEWVESHVEPPDHFMKPYFPAYRTNDLRAYLSRYYDEYYDKASAYDGKYENFALIDMNLALNTEQGKRSIFNFIGRS